MNFEEEHTQSLIENDEPEVVIESDDKVSPQGEKIPDNVIPDESPVVDETPPKTDETTLKTDESEQGSRIGGTGDEVQLTETEKAFADDENLVKRYGSLSEMINQQGRTDKYIGKLEEERNYFRSQATSKEEPKVEAPSIEDFTDDPMNAVEKLVDNRMVGVNAKLQKMEYDNFVQSKADFADVELLMDEQLRQNPELKMLGYGALPILYKMAKADQISRAKATQPQPAPVPKPDKTHAETSAGKKIAVLSKDDPRYWHDKTNKEIEDEVGFAPGQE